MPKTRRKQILTMIIFLAKCTISWGLGTHWYVYMWGDPIIHPWMH